MKTFKNICAQGDVRFKKIETFPAGLKEVAPENGNLIIAHSETGHNHVMVLDREAPAPSVRMFAGDDPFTAFLQVNYPTSLEHLRGHDTHEPIMFSRGNYEIRRQREYTPEGYRRVAD